MTTTTGKSVEGGCGCGHVRYRLTATPLFVHCCHCTDCQTETGTGFALNLMIEASAAVLTRGCPIKIATPSESGRGQLISRCPQCQVAVWSNYYAAGPAINTIRVGTLDLEARRSVSPDVHIYTRSKLPWVVIPDGARVFEEFYDIQELWPEESNQRLIALGPVIDQWKAEGGKLLP